MHLLQELDQALVKLINNRFYSDYNATAPLANSVKDWLASGVLPFGNPSSIHSTGKQSKRFINETSDYLKNFFSLKYFDIFYHSGATEGINDIVKGFCLKSLKDKTPFHFVCFATDHSCVVNQKSFVELVGGTFTLVPVKKSGEFDREAVISLIKGLSGKVLVNYTLVNNETGVVFTLSDILNIKRETSCLVHVDAVQLLGKVNKEDYKLSDELDFYTFSGHKFGAMKGIGFSFVKDRNENFLPLISGGGQQMKMRSGTENVHGIYSLKLSLEELDKNFDGSDLSDAKNFFEDFILSNYQDKIKIISKTCTTRNFNTTYMIVDGVKTDILITAFDLAGIDLSSGSACSSGAIEPSRILLAMGHTEEEAKNSIRVSFSPFTKKSDIEEILPKFQQIFDRFLKK